MQERKKALNMTQTEPVEKDPFFKPTPENSSSADPYEFEDDELIFRFTFPCVSELGSDLRSRLFFTRSKAHHTARGAVTNSKEKGLFVKHTSFFCRLKKQTGEFL